VQRAVGVEVSDSAIPEWQTNAQLVWSLGGIDATWGWRYIAAVVEDCTNATIAAVPGCLNPQQQNRLGSVTYNDVQVAWRTPLGVEGLSVAVGANNVFGKEPPVCVSCSLNGYDAGTYDLPGAFWYARANWKF